MSVSFIPQDKVYAVCTYQLSPSPQKFSYSREKPSVFYQNTDQPVLTVDDKNLMEEFKCKSPANMIGSLLAFGAGLVLFATGPIGWVIAGAIAVVAIGVTIAIVTHKCTDPLKGGNWFLAHNSVKINGSSAITRSSILKCGNSGILTPFFDKAAAEDAASSIAIKNGFELGINIVASAGAGYYLPASFSGWGAASIGGRVWLAGGRFIAGYGAFSILNFGFRGIIRGLNENLGDVKDNITYDQMNNHKENVTDSKTGKTEEQDIDGNTLWGKPSKPDDLVQDFGDIIEVKKEGPWYKISSYKKKSVMGKITTVITTTRIHNSNIALLQKLENLDGLNRQQLRANPLAQQLLAELNSGKYPEWKNASTHYNSGRMNPSMIDDGKNLMTENTKSSLNNVNSSYKQGILFLIPFIGTMFSEAARVDIAQGMAADLAAEPNGSSLVARTPVD
ncbi:hypothetical protein [Chryseobacterium contaminans]|uniref:hypothetical protein n=1 Tax=Chryseobacterium contaminans TaxID=1423959 RepID=UPI003019D6ED